MPDAIGYRKFRLRFVFEGGTRQGKAHFNKYIQDRYIDLGNNDLITHECAIRMIKSYEAQKAFDKLNNQ